MLNKNNLNIILIITVVVGFLAGVVGELAVNSFLLPDPYLTFKSYNDLSKRIDDLMGNSSGNDFTAIDKLVAQAVAKAKNANLAIYRSKKLGVSYKDSLQDADYLGQAVAITSDGWLLASGQYAYGSFFAVDNEGAVYAVEKTQREKRANLTFLKIKAGNLAVVEFVRKAELTPGQTVFLINKNNSVSMNNLSDLYYSVDKDNLLRDSEEFYKYYELSAKTEKEQANNPIFDLNGRLVAFNMAEGVAIPCDYFLSTMKSLNSLNEFVWPNLGIKYYDLSEVLNPVTKEKKGAYVVSVIAASSASNALFSGDIIKSVERDEISKERTLSEIISQYKVGETLRFAVLRDEKEITVEVKLK